MKIRGNTVGTPMKRPDFNQTDPKKSDYILNNPIPAITENDEDKIVKVKDGEYKLVDDNGAKYSSGLDYATSLDGQGYMVTGLGTCTDKNIVIPDTHNGLPVTALRYQAFYNCTSLISIEMPDSITSIGENMAFRGCTSLKSVRIPDSVTSIETATFKGCSALEKVVMGNLITKIGDGAFNGCTSLLNIDIPNSVTKIGGATFENCTSLTSVVIPKSVTSIGSQAFKGCTSLTIYCEAESQPSGWASNWNYSNCPVVWGFANDFVSVNEKIDDITFNVGISADGYWIINGEKTEYKAQGEKGDTYTLTEADKKVIVEQVSNRVATVDKVKVVSMSGGLENISVADDEYSHGIYWDSNFQMNDDEHFDGNMLVNCKVSHHLPIAAGEHVEFEVDEDKVVRVKVDTSNLPTVDKVTSIDTWAEGVSSLDTSDGIAWRDGFAFNDGADLSGNTIAFGEIYHRVPILAGNGINFAYTDDGQYVKINATGGSGKNVVGKFTVEVDYTTTVWNMLTAMQEAGANIGDWNVVNLNGMVNGMFAITYQPFGDGSFGLLRVTNLVYHKSIEQVKEWSSTSVCDALGTESLYRYPLPFYDDSYAGKFLTLQSNGGVVEPQWTSIPSAEGVNFNE